MGFFRRIFGKPEDDDDNSQQNEQQVDAAGQPAASTIETDNSLTDNSLYDNDSLVDTAELNDKTYDDYPDRTNRMPSDAGAQNLNTLPNSQTGHSNTNPTNDPDATLPTPPDEYVSGTPQDSFVDDDDDEPWPPIQPSVTRPLPSEPVAVFQPVNGHIIFGQSSDPGMVRANNQDSAWTFYNTINSVESQPDFGLFIVADGMGGHHDGEKASALTARTVATQIMREIFLPMFHQETINDADRPTIAESLIKAVKDANKRVLREIPEGGTTLTAIAVMGNMAHVAHVGDSRAYLIIDDQIEQITRDHSLVQRLIELGQITLEESYEHPQRNVLYRAIGQNADLEVDTLTRRLPPGAKILICSDGLWSSIPESELLEIITSTSNPQEASDKLIARANTYGGHDNITAVLLAMPEK